MTSTELVKRKAASIATLLEKNKNQLLAALPKHIQPDRMIRVTMTTLRRTPKLLSCTPESLIGSILQAAQLGLEIGGLGHAYLVPYKKECTLIVGYKGLIDLARRSGQISAIYSHCVYEGDDFQYLLGLKPDIHHARGTDWDPLAWDAITHAYAVATFRQGGEQFDVMARAELDAIRQRSRARDQGPWVTDLPEMYKKTVLRRLCKMLPSSVELQQAVAIDEQVDRGLRPDLGVDLTSFNLGAVAEEIDEQTGEVLEVQEG